MNAEYRQMVQAFHDATCGVCGEKASSLRIDPETRQPVEGSGTCRRCLHAKIGRLLGIGPKR